MKKLMWSVVAVVVAAGGLTGLLEQEAAPADAASPAIAWGACPAAPAGVQIDPKQQCGTLSVPLDYRHPDGKQITLAVSRIPAADPAKRRGVLLLNPGGPGSEGLDLPSSFAASAAPAVAAHYDLIGFDPRGVGHSSPVTCGLTAAELMPPYPFPAPDGSIAGNTAFARSTAARCAADSGSELPFITTANTARDMDRIRQALGEQRVSYYGTSYGTYLGAVYATLFPQHVDRMVLDSAVDPTKVWYDEIRLQSSGMALRFPDAAQYAAAHAAEVGFGSSAAAVTRSYLALASRLDARPVPIPGTSTQLSGDLLRYLSYALLSQDSEIPVLAQVWRAAGDLAAGDASAEDTGTLAQILALASPAAAVSPGVPQDNAIAAAYAVTCDDVAWPRGTSSYAANVAADRKQFPLSDGFPANIWPCAFWPTTPVEPAVTVSDHGSRNILMLQNDRDPATPLVSGEGMHKALGARSRLVTVDAGGHVVYGTPGPDACATAIANAYLVGGAMPAHDEQCS